MICKSCREGGQLLSMSRNGDKPPASKILKIIKALHKECSDCDCQHKTSRVLALFSDK